MAQDGKGGSEDVYYSAEVNGTSARAVSLYFGGKGVR